MRRLYNWTRRALVGGACMAAACAAGCTSLYHITMEEMALCERDLLALRVAEAREKHVEARDALAVTFDRLEAGVGEETCRWRDPQAELSRRINQAQLHAWNLSRRIASVEDAGERFLAVYSGRQHDKIKRQYRRTLDQMRTAERDLGWVAQAMQEQTKMALAGVDPAQVRSLQPIGITRAQMAEFTARLNEAIRTADELLFMLDEQEVVFAHGQ